MIICFIVQFIKPNQTIFIFMLKSCKDNQRNQETQQQLNFDQIIQQYQSNFDSQNQWPFQDNLQVKKEQKSQQEQSQKIKDIQALSVRTISITPGNKLDGQQKQSIQRTLAQKFITIGFGYIVNMKAVRKRHKVAIDASYYNNTMSSIVRKTFRTIQQFLLKQCKQANVKRITHYQGSLLRSPMLQCTKWLKKQELDTFYKFICRAYNLKKVFISEDQASRLYGQIVQSARKGHQVSHIILHRTKKKCDSANSQGLTFSYAPSSTIAKNVSNNQAVNISNKFVQH